MAAKRRLQDQNRTQNPIMHDDSDEQLHEDDISPSLSDADTDTDKEGDAVEVASAQWTDRP
jgi:hypothetical protein